MIDVTDPAYGAVCDGVTDDTAAIQSAFDQMGEVRLPPGVYARYGELLFRENTHIVLEPGAVIKRMGAASTGINRLPGDAFGGYSGRGNILIEGGTIDSNAVAFPGYCNGISIGHAHKVTIRGVTFLNTPGLHAVEINSSRFVRIDDCEFSGFLNDPDQSDRSFSEAIQIDGSYTEAGSSFSPYDQTPCDDVTVSGCRASASDDLPCWPALVGSHGYADLTVNHLRIKILGNTMQDCTARPIRVWHWEQAIIAHNQIAGAGDNGISVSQAKHVDALGNQITDPIHYGIWVNDHNTDIGLAANRIIGAGRGENNTFSAIRVEAIGSNIVVRGNIARKRSSGNNAKWGFSASGSVTGLLRNGNDWRGSGVTTGVSDSSVSPVTSASDAG